MHLRKSARIAFNCTNMIMEKYIQDLAVKGGEREAKLDQELKR